MGITRQQLILLVVFIGIIVLIVLRNGLPSFGRASAAEEFADCTTTLGSENGVMICYGAVCDDPTKVARFAEAIGCELQ